MKQKLALLSAIGALILILGTGFKVYFYFQDALAQGIQKVDEKLSQQIQKTDQKVNKAFDAIEYQGKFMEFGSLQDRIWKIEDKFGKNPKDPVILKTLRDLYADKKAVDDRLKELKPGK